MTKKLPQKYTISHSYNVREESLIISLRDSAQQVNTGINQDKNAKEML